MLAELRILASSDGVVVFTTVLFRISLNKLEGGIEGLERNVCEERADSS